MSYNVCSVKKKSNNLLKLLNQKLSVGLRHFVIIYNTVIFAHAFPVTSSHSF